MTPSSSTGWSPIWSSFQASSSCRAPRRSNGSGSRRARERGQVRIRKMDLFVLQFSSGLIKAMFLFLIASGLSLIFGVTRVINLAHGSFYMLGAYLLLPLSPLGFWSGLLLAPLAVAMLGGLVYVVLLTFALILIVGDLTKLAWGTQFITVSGPVLLSGVVKVLGQDFPKYNLLILALGPMLALGLWAVFYRTRWGLLVRAAAMDREMLGALGVDVRRLLTTTFIVGSWLAGFGGALSAPLVSLEPNMDASIIMEAFSVVVIGGLGSFAGSLLGSVLIGELEAFGILVFPAISLALIFGLMAVILILRPWGLFG